MAILIIARLTIREAQRRRLLWVALFMGVAFLLVFGLAFHFIRRDIELHMAGAEDLAFVSVFLLTAGLYAVNLLVNVVAVLVSVTTISGEIESHTIDAIVTKPIPRWQVVVGKWLGYAALVLLYLVFLVGGLMLIGGIVGASILPVLSDKFRKRRIFLVICVTGMVPGILGTQR